MQAEFAKIETIADKHFDFVVIGGGTAGLTLASRLSENSNVTVAVLEAGNPHLNDVNISYPDGFIKQFRQPEYDWLFATEPQTHAKNKVIMWNRGKGLGGSSSMNYLMWTTPHLKDIDAFEKLGNTGWNWDTVMKYVKKVERQGDVGNTAGGPIPVGYTRTPSGAELPFQLSMKNVGISAPTPEVLASGQTCGSWMCKTNFDPESGLRVHSVPAYLLPALHRPNLHVLTGAYVTKLLFHDTPSIEAAGVEFEYGQNLHKVYVDKEVLLSAGTVKSPQILELSGIGSPSVLRAADVALKLDLPAVGENLRDKVMVPVALEMKDGHGIFTYSFMHNPKFQQQLKDAYPNALGGFFSGISGITMIPVQALPDDVPPSLLKTAKQFIEDVQQQSPCLGVYHHLLNELQDGSVPDFEILVTPFVPGPDPTKPYIGLVLGLNHPFSVGDIHIKSNNPKSAPVIDPHVFEAAVDLDVLVEAVKFTRKVISTAPFCDLVSKELKPGPTCNTDDEIKAAIQENITTIWHSSGTLSMLPKQNGGVVDTNLKVYGTANIRVVDMSVVPVPIGGHPQTVVYAIAERAADIIKLQYGI